MSKCYILRCEILRTVHPHPRHPRAIREPSEGHPRAHPPFELGVSDETTRYERLVLGVDALRARRRYGDTAIKRLDALNLLTTSSFV